MLKSLFKIIIGLFFIFLLNSGCRTRCNCNDSYKKIPEETKQWFWFENGSWWVYRMAEDTTVFDTMVLFGKSDDFSNKFCRSDYAPAIGCSEVLEVALKHSNSKYFPKYSVDTINAGFDIVQAYSDGKSDFLSYESMGVFLGLSIKLNEKYDLYILKDTFSNFKLNNILIRGLTIHTQKSNNIVVPDQVTDIWWAKDIGLVKIIRNEGTKPKTTWELIKYEIK